MKDNTATSSSAWFSIAVTVAPEASEAIEYAFNSLDALGTEINHLQKKDLETVTVVGYFNDLPDDERVQDEMHYALRVYGFGEDAVLTLERSHVEDADWLAEWKKHWNPTTVGGFVVAPPWSELDESAKIVIRIEPKMAFGTGTHETTRLCLAAIDKYYEAGESFLDVGTGTGILAIAAAKINLKSEISTLTLVACDTDTDSVSLAKENAELNGVGDMIDFSIGSISDDGTAFDFVCANVTLDVIVPLLPLLLAKAKRVLVLSGILVEQRDEIGAACRELGITNREIETDGEWISLMINRHSQIRHSF